MFGCRLSRIEAKRQRWHLEGLKVGGQDAEKSDREAAKDDLGLMSKVCIFC